MDLLGYGLINLDDVIVVPTWERDQKTTSAHAFYQVGGPVPVAMQAAQRLGMSTTFVGVVADDLAGHMLEARMNTFGIKTHIAFQSGTTSRSFVLIDQRDASRTLVNIPGDGLGLPDIPLMISRIQAGTIVHIDGRDLETDLMIAAHANAVGAQLSIDLGTMRNGRECLLEKCNIILASQNAARTLLPDYPNDHGRQIRKLQSFGADICGITLAESGVIIADASGIYRLPSYTVRTVVDTNGAGDTFHGAFLYAYGSRGLSTMEAANYAQAAVACRISHYGNDAGLPTHEIVTEFLVNYSL